VFAFQEGSLNIDPTDNNRFSYRASITNSDAVAPAEIELLVKAMINGLSHKLEWEHTPYIHYFTVPDINRTDATQSLELSFNKKVKNGNDLIVEIPGSKIFSVLEVKASDENSQTIDIILSDNVDASQDLQGLITVDGVNRLNFNVQGNIIRVYSNERDKMQGVVQINIYKGIKNSFGEKLKSDATYNVSFASAKPAVAFIGEGTFTPAEGNVLIPFSAVALKAVQLRVVKVFNQNMNFYLQDGNYNYSSDYQLRRVGRIILDKKIPLEKEGHPINANKWLRFNLNNNITLQMIKRPMGNQMIFYNNVSNQYPNQATELPVDSEYNIPGWSELMYLKNSNYNQNRLSDALTLSATVTPLEGWNIVGEMKMRLDVEHNDMKLVQPYYETPQGKYKKGATQKQGYAYPGMSWKNTYFDSYSRGSVFNYYLSPNVSSSYTHQWGSHFFKAMAGFQMELREDSQEAMYKDGVMDDQIYSFENASGNIMVSEARTHWSTMGMYARLNWNYNNIYFLEVSGRYDGSSRFAKGNRWGFFPSFSAGYDIARTDYFKALDLPVSQLKVRVSYGRLGNQNGAGLYDYRSFIELDASSQNAWILPGVSDTPSRGTIVKTPKLISPYITWEKVDNANLGIDLMLLKNRLSITADIYQRTTRDMIGPAEALPGISGVLPTDRAKVNNATLRNRGWELSVNWNDKLKCGFSYGIGFNVFNYKAVVTKYNNPSGTIYNNHTGYAANKGYYEGMDVGEIWGYHVDGLFKTDKEAAEYQAKINDKVVNGRVYSSKVDGYLRAGDVRFADLNGDNVIGAGAGTVDDPGDKQIIGNTTPRYSYSFRLDASWNGFDVSAFFQGIGKRDWYPSYSTTSQGANSFWGPYSFPSTSFVEKSFPEDCWTEDNRNAFFPRIRGYQSYSGGSLGTVNDRYIQNIAYLRFKNLSIGYTLPISKRIFEKVRVYVSGENLYYWSPLKKHNKTIDPELAISSSTYSSNTGSGYAYPRVYTVGVDITF